MTVLEYLRRKNNLPQEKVSEISGVKRWKISMAETHSFCLSQEDAVSIAGVLNCAPESLLRPVELIFSRPLDKELDHAS